MNTRPKLITVLPWIIVFTLILGIIDWRTGYELNYFVFYFIPVSIAAWLYGNEISIFISIVSAFTWAYADTLSGHIYPSTYLFVWNTLIRLTSFTAIGISVSKVSMLLRSEKNKTEALEKALSEIKILESFLSICCVCKKIRNENGQWQHLESYISAHSDTTFSHDYCPECSKKALDDAGSIKK